MWLRRARREHPASAHPRTPAARPAPDVRSTNEFDAYLEGTYADWLLANGQPVPSWAWVNRVAHASLEELDAIADGQRLALEVPEVVVWEAVTTYLAKEMVARIDGDLTRLRNLQLDVVIPVELQLAAHRWAQLAPVDLASRVLIALHDTPRA
ncbi:MAG TPA: hypothetical protein VFV00_09375 [Acidimicrobiales bacterium]|nr:hypothetical protein [Acidimicrobiales bacterium]